eukprot:1163177-Amphidinium_carterae.1
MPKPPPAQKGGHLENRWFPNALSSRTMQQNTTQRLTLESANLAKVACDLQHGVICRPRAIVADNEVNFRHCMGIDEGFCLARNMKMG